MLNMVCISGRLVKDPELRRTQNGTAVAGFTLAVDRDFSGKDGGEKQTDFFDCVAWKGTAEFVTQYFTKGRTAIVAGRLQIRDWTDKDGNKRKTAEIIAENVYFGDSKPSQGSAQAAPGKPYTAPSEATYPQQTFENVLPATEDDDLPFD